MFGCARFPGVSCAALHNASEARASCSPPTAVAWGHPDYSARTHTHTLVEPNLKWWESIESYKQKKKGSILLHGLCKHSNGIFWFGLELVSSKYSILQPISALQAGWHGAFFFFLHLILLWGKRKACKFSPSQHWVFFKKKHYKTLNNIKKCHRSAACVAQFPCRYSVLFLLKRANLTDFSCG